MNAEIANTGARDGDEVVQVYVRDRAANVKRPNLQLVAFQRVSLKAGEKRTLTFSVLPRDLAYWDEGAKSWALAPGAYNVLVGSSSRDIRVTGEFQSPALGRWPDGR